MPYECGAPFGAQVSDFGLSTLFKPGQRSASAAQHGALAYMPPELISADTLSYATDVYSFGVLLWEMLTAQVRGKPCAGSVRRKFAA